MAPSPPAITTCRTTGLPSAALASTTFKNIDVDLPRDRLVVITGLSGSGKSSLAFDTIYAEGQRRYVESLSAYARQFLEQMEKPDVDLIDGLSPAISIEQKTTGSNPRSTVGTVTEIYDYLRLLFANVGVPHCPTCDREISSQSLDRIVGHGDAYSPDERINVLAPLVRGRKGEFKRELADLRPQGYTRARIDGNFMALERRHRSRSTQESRYLRARRPPHRQAGNRAAPDRVDRAAPCARRRHRRDQYARGRRSAVLAHGWPVRTAASAFRKCRRARFHSTRLTAPARRARGLAPSTTSIPRRIVPDDSCRSPRRDCCRGRKATKVPSTTCSQDSPGVRASIATVPFAKLPKKLRDIVLFGAPGKRSSNGNSKGKAPKDPFGADFEGVVPNLRRRFDEGTWTDQEALEPYRALQPCPACEGARLRPESRAVRVKGRRLSEFVQLPIVRRAAASSRPWNSTSANRSIAAPCRQGDSRSAAVPGGRWRRLPDARPKRRHAVRRRRTAHPAGDADRIAADGRVVRAR